LFVGAFFGGDTPYAATPQRNLQPTVRRGTRLPDAVIFQGLMCPTTASIDVQKACEGRVCPHSAAGDVSTWCRRRVMISNTSWLEKMLASRNVLCKAGAAGKYPKTDVSKHVLTRPLLTLLFAVTRLFADVIRVGGC
jgi:hypothetical protein